MKLTNIDYNFDIILKENIINVLVIESPKVLSDIYSHLWNQYNNGEGHFVLFNQDKKLNISKNIELICNIFDLNINNKKIINKLYSELNTVINDNCLLEKQQLNTHVYNFLDHLIQQTPYPLIYNTDCNLLDLFKVYDLKLDTISLTHLESIVEYLKIMNQICHINIFIFIGLKTLLTVSELEQLYEFVSYEKIHIITIESFQSSVIHNEKYLIIDKDQCMIEL